MWNVYATVWGGDIYKQTGGVQGRLFPLKTSRGWIGMTADSSGISMRLCRMGYLHEKAVGGTPNLNGGELVLSSGVGKGIGDKAKFHSKPEQLSPLGMLRSTSTKPK